MWLTIVMHKRNSYFSKLPPNSNTASGNKRGRMKGKNATRVYVSAEAAVMNNFRQPKYMVCYPTQRYSNTCQTEVYSPAENDR